MIETASKTAIPRRLFQLVEREQQEEEAGEGRDSEGLEKGWKLAPHPAPRGTWPASLSLTGVLRRVTKVSALCISLLPKHRRWGETIQIGEFISHICIKMFCFSRINTQKVDLAKLYIKD